jgi:alpha-tubulin suppressor-like RCC1 family protein
MEQTEVYLWGSNANGQMGIGEPSEAEESSIPRVFAFDTQIA